MNDTYTPHPETTIPEDGYRRMAYTFDSEVGTVVWIYVGCKHHCEEHIRLSREVGDTGVFHIFSSEPVTCTVCWAFEHGRPLKILWNQTALETRKP